MNSINFKVTMDIAKLDEMIRETSQPVIPMIVADGVEYGVYQELGTSRMAARPCARPAVEATRGWFESSILALEMITSKAVQEIVKKTAYTIERLWKQNIQIKKVIDTGAYLNSVHVEEGAGVDTGVGG